MEHMEDLTGAGDHQFAGKDGNGEITEEQAEEYRREYPELFDNDDGFQEAASDLLSPYEIRRHLNQVLLTSLAYNEFPYGRTQDHTPPKKVLDSFDYFRLKSQHNMAASAVNNLFRAIRRNVPEFDALTMDQTIRELTSYTGYAHIRYDCCIDTCICFVAEFSHYESCPVCEKPRWINEKVCGQIILISPTRARLIILIILVYLASVDV